MERILNYSYRGLLKSCNYSCSYCPFSKRSSDASVLQADREALMRFCCYISKLEASPHSLQILLLPYGEGMLHPHYTEALSYLSSLPSVRRVSCQTNLSWNIDQVANAVLQSGGRLSHISFWCSFHPQCTSPTDFLYQCNRLDHYGIRYCVGMVARPGSESLAREIRNALSGHTYFWLNRMDGLQRPYTPAEIACFSELDPFFPLELNSHLSDLSTCQGGKTALFVQADGRTALCPIAGKFSGNIYHRSISTSSLSCKAKHCHCYLAYSNRTEIGLKTFFGQGAFLRIPERIGIKNLFLDIDGTLTGPNGNLLPGIEKTLSLLAGSVNLYFATALPYSYVQRKYRKLFPLFTGGIFAGGAHIRFFRSFPEHYFYLSPTSVREIRLLLSEYSCSPSTIRRYNTPEGTYRITIKSKYADTLFHRLSSIKDILIFQEKGLVTIISKATDKGKALAYLLRLTKSSRDSAAAIGNDISDIPMFKEVKYPLSVPHSAEPVQHSALCSMPVTLLPVFFGM